MTLENTPDPMSVQAGEFVQPAAPKVTEDTAYTFTFAQIVAVMQVETNGDPYRLRITAPAAGSLGITPPLFLSSGQSLSWTPPPNAYTKSYEAALAAFTVQVEHPDGSNTSTGAIFSTPVVGVPETVPSDDTIDSVDPLVVDRGIACEFTYEQLVAKLHGYTDLDRDAGIVLNLTSPGIPSISAWQIRDGVVSEFNPNFIGIDPGERLRILLPDTQAFGTFAIAEWIMTASYGGQANATCPNPKLIVRNPNGGGQSSSGGGGGGGSCGLGAAGGLLLISIMCLGRNRRACAG